MPIRVRRKGFFSALIGSILFVTYLSIFYLNNLDNLIINQHSEEERFLKPSELEVSTVVVDEHNEG